MPFRRTSHREMLLACADPEPDDGLDPRSQRRLSHRKVANRKALQVCGQVARTLSSFLAAECGDDLLRDLQVDSVCPAPYVSRLLVTLSLVGTAPLVEVNRYLEHLERARGKLRMEIAAVVNRRRVPDLTFRLMGPPS